VLVFQEDEIRGNKLKTEEILKMVGSTSEITKGIFNIICSFDCYYYISQFRLILSINIGPTHGSSQAKPIIKVNTARHHQLHPSPTTSAAAFAVKRIMEQ